MDRKMNYPDSDESARDKHPGLKDEDTTEISDQNENLQTSLKTGKHSSVEKLSASRPEFGTGRGAVPVDGAFGREDDESKEHHTTGRNASPGTNQFRCETCGRYFNTPSELSQHEIECRLAKAATSGGGQ
jgi:hypothetical protein